MKLTDATLRIISDSRGEKTIEAELRSGNLLAKSSVPSGKSRGEHEVYVSEPEAALSKFESIKSRLLADDFGTQADFDGFLIALDGTPSKNNLGGNLILALSLAWARLKAQDENKELFQYISQISGIKNQNSKIPIPIFNVINGGAHAQNNLDFQEFQVIPQTENFRESLNLGQEFYKTLKLFLEGKYGPENIRLGDEAGFSAPFLNNEEALEVLHNLILKNNYPLRIGLDAAATHFFKEGGYVVNGKKCSVTELKYYYFKLMDKYHLLSIEDPFAEEAFDDFSKFSESLTVHRRETFLITDDLTTTNKERLESAIKMKAGQAIILKPNQIGSLSETLGVARIAESAGWKKIVSHRSGETMDDFVADLAVGIGAWGIKAGAPAQPERLSKYERLLEISTMTK